MSRRRLAITGSLMLFALAMLLTSWIPTGFTAEFASSALLQVGSTLALVPAVFYIERSFERRIERATAAIYQGLEGSAAIRPDAKWEEVFPLLERVWLTRYHSELYVAVPNIELWLGFSTFKLNEGGVDGSRISIFYADPTVAENPRLDTFVNWIEGMTLEDVARRIRGNVDYIPRYKGKGPITASGICAGLREQVESLIG